MEVLIELICILVDQTEFSSILHLLSVYHIKCIASLSSFISKAYPTTTRPQTFRVKPIDKSTMKSTPRHVEARIGSPQYTSHPLAL